LGASPFQRLAAVRGRLRRQLVSADPARLAAGADGADAAAPDLVAARAVHTRIDPRRCGWLSDRLLFVDRGRRADRRILRPYPPLPRVPALGPRMGPVGHY